MQNNNSQFGPPVWRDLLYLSLAAIATAFLWREQQGWRSALEEIRSEQQTLLRDIRSVQTSIAALETKMGKAPKASPAEGLEAAPKRPRQTRVKRKDETKA